MITESCIGYFGYSKAASFGLKNDCVGAGATVSRGFPCRAKIYLAEARYKKYCRRPVTQKSDSSIYLHIS